MKNKVFAAPMSLPQVVNGAVSPFGPYCMGYLNPGASGMGYISTMKLSTDIVSMQGLDLGTQGIVSYDRCEKDDAYIGQINMLTASSFCGLNGALWGYDLATADEIANGTLQPLYYENQNGGQIPVYPVEPLLDAAMRLFGVDEQRRFPPMPGAHVVCANKSATFPGPTWVWSYIAIAIAADRSYESNLFIEDAGNYDSPSWAKTKLFLEINQHSVTKSIIMCGQDQDVLFSKIFVGYKFEWVPQGYVGCALTCAPYVVMAQDAIPPNMQASDIIGMTISQWEQALGLPPLPPLKKRSIGWKKPVKRGKKPKAKAKPARKAKTTSTVKAKTAAKAKPKAKAAKRSARR